MSISESLVLGHARVVIHQERPHWDAGAKKMVFAPVGDDGIVYNVITNAGRVCIHAFAYGVGTRANGFNYVGLSDDGTVPTVLDEVLPGELSTDGLSRGSGTVVLPVGEGTQTTISRVFTYTGTTSQTVQKSALFTDPEDGVMNHVVLFDEQKTLFPGDTLSVTYTITLQ